MFCCDWSFPHFMKLCPGQENPPPPRLCPVHFISSRRGESPNIIKNTHFKGGKVVYCGSPKLASSGQIRETMRLFFAPPPDSPFIQVNPSNIPTHRPTGDQKRNNSEVGKPVASHKKEANRASVKNKNSRVISEHFQLFPAAPCAPPIRK